MKARLILALLAAGAVLIPTWANAGVSSKSAQKSNQAYWKAIPLTASGMVGSYQDRAAYLEAAMPNVLDLADEDMPVVPVAIHTVTIPQPPARKIEVKP